VLEYRADATAAKDAQIAALEAQCEAMAGALDELANREQEYRIIHDIKGDGHRDTGRAWDLMCRAGNAARAALAQHKGDA